jgi:moderate conductance mechanosensitive channel
MSWATFAALHRLSPARVRGGSAWRGACRSAGRCALALGLVLAFASALAAADPTGLEREIRETREIAAEVSRAVHRVETENLKLLETLGSEVQNLTAEDVTATMLRLGRLDADTARLYVTTLENRIANGETALRLLEEDFERRGADLEGAPADTLETLGAQAELQQLWEMRTVRIDLIDALRNLRNAESERLALADEHLALLSSRADLRTIHQDGRFDQDPRVVAIRAIISRLSHVALRLDNEAGSSRPKTAAADPARKRLLQLQSGDAIIRSSVRVADLELVGTENQLDFYEELIGDDAIPIPILQQARAKLDDDAAQLKSRLAALHGDRLTLEGQRELIRAQAADSADGSALPIGPVQDLAELLDFQQADFTRLQQRVADLAATLDTEITQRELGALRERRALPANVGHWQLLKGGLTHLPQMTVDYWRAVVSDVVARLGALPGRALAGLVAAIVVLVGAIVWLNRTGLRRMAALNPAGSSSLPLEAMRRTLPSLLPVTIWLLVAWRAGLDRRPLWLLAAALGLWPLVAFVLCTSRLFLDETGDRGRGRATAWMRTALLAAAGLGAIVLLLRAVPMLPSVVDLVERAGFLCIGLAAIGGWILRERLLGAFRRRAMLPAAGQRLLAIATAAMVGVLLLAAAAGLAGWINLGWAIARGGAAFLGAAGLALFLCAILRDLATALEGRHGSAAEDGAPPNAREVIQAGYRLAVVGVIVGAAWLVAGIDVRSETATAAFWILVAAGALPFVLQPVQTLVASFLQIDPERRPDGSISIPAICVDRGIRALLIIGTVLALAWALEFDLVALATGDTLLTRIVRGAFNVAVILLVADLVWHLARTAIDSRLQTTDGLDPIADDEARRRARLRTLLPILRNMLLIVIAVTAVLMALSSIGVQIGPLLAGAGVVGIAVGFGAQTLVRDIFAGMFFLLDDAFRVGEYIQSGSYKGTVEAFSLRSVKIRHHRGSLFTVPFGELGAVQNMSRDWVIDKLNVSVTYNTDLAKVKKVIKEVSKQIMAEPELAANMIEPLKMQGVEQFGDYAIEIRMKMMTKPGQQFVVRRRAYALIKQAFNANDIEFAVPTVNVATTGGHAEPAAAKEALQLLQREPAAT